MEEEIITHHTRRLTTQDFQGKESTFMGMDSKENTARATLMVPCSSNNIQVTYFSNNLEECLMLEMLNSIRHSEQQQRQETEAEEWSSGLAVTIVPPIFGSKLY